MTDKQNLIELPLDAAYVTADGMYMAGYLWGRHARSTNDAKQMFDCVSYPDFLRGVEDGYGDWLAHAHDQLARIRDKPKNMPLGDCEHGVDLDKEFCPHGCLI